MNDVAQKAYAIIQNIQIATGTQEGSTTPFVNLSLSINEDPTGDIVPPEGTKLHVSQIAPTYCTKEALFDLFKPFGRLSCYFT